MEIGIFISGFILGVAVVWIIFAKQQNQTRTIARELVQQSQQEKTQELERLLGSVKDAFGALSMETLSKTTNEFLKLADQKFGEQTRANQIKLENKKSLIDQTLTQMKSELQKVHEHVQKIEQDRKQSFGELTEQLKNTAGQTMRLQEVTNQLNTALSHSQTRGQWGERMAEDVLRMAGFIEGINYLKQKTENGGRPDFTFLLPNNLKINMDVKFPLSNYLGYLEAESEIEQNNLKAQFLKDVRKRIKEVTNREYINPSQNTVDYVIVFIPNEQVYTFINEYDRELLDDALKAKVILSSPVTLYAVLAVIRQAVDNFNLERTASEILSLLSEFYNQWEKFKAGMEKMGRRLDDAQREYQDLITTRTNRLEKPLIKIQNIRESDELRLPRNVDSEQEHKGQK